MDKHSGRGRTPEITREAIRLRALLEDACARATVPLRTPFPR